VSELFPGYYPEPFENFRISPSFGDRAWSNDLLAGMILSLVASWNGEPIEKLRVQMRKLWSSGLKFTLRSPKRHSA